MKQDNIRIAAPCTLDWTKMKPTAGGRFCGDCKKVVRDLSKMTEADARELLTAQAQSQRGGDELCVRYLYDRSGKIFFQEAAAHLVPANNLLSRAKRAAATVALAALPMATAACDVIGGPLGLTSETNEKLPPDIGEMMGGMEYVPPPPVENDEDAGSDGGDTDGGAAKADAAQDVDAAEREDGGADGGVAIY